MSYNKKTGIDSDYMNAFLGLRNCHTNFEAEIISKTEFLEILETPIELYEEYLEKHYPEQLEEARRMADKEVLSELNDIVSKYNKLPAANKLERIETCTSLWLKIMKGEN